MNLQGLVTLPIFYSVGQSQAFVSPVGRSIPSARINTLGLPIYTQASTQRLTTNGQLTLCDESEIDRSIDHPTLSSEEYQFENKRYIERQEKSGYRPIFPILNPACLAPNEQYISDLTSQKPGITKLYIVYAENPVTNEREPYILAYKDDYGFVSQVVFPMEAMPDILDAIFRIAQPSVSMVELKKNMMMNTNKVKQGGSFIIWGSLSSGGPECRYDIIIDGQRRVCTDRGTSASISGEDDYMLETVRPMLKKIFLEYGPKRLVGEFIKQDDYLFKRLEVIWLIRSIISHTQSISRITSSQYSFLKNPDELLEKKQKSLAEKQLKYQSMLQENPEFSELTEDSVP